VPAAYALARSNTRSARFVEELLVLPIVLPGLATALALLSVYGGWSAFRSSMWFIVAGHVVFTLPFMVRSVAAVCAGPNLRTMEEGAASLGASFTQRFLTIVLPNARPGIVAGALAVLNIVDRRIQPDMDAAYARHQDTAGRTRRCVTRPCA